MTGLSQPLPIDEALPALRSALAERSGAVLVAPPGAGKTTRVPLALLDEPWAKSKRLILIEPRRLAARAAAARMAATLGEKVGETIGLRVRLTSLVSKRTRIEVVTEGVFTRMILDDPALEGDRGRPVRRVPRALARRRSRSRLRARRAGRPARGPAPSRHVGDARRRASANAPGRRAADRKRGSRLSCRDALCRPQPERPHRGRGRARHARRARERSTARSSSSCRGRARSGALRRPWARASRAPMSTWRRSMARSTPMRRISPSRHRRRGGARSCSPPRSPRRPSPSKACASSSIPASCAFRFMSPTSA